MRLIVEVLDRKTLCWTTLACQDGVGIEAAPAIVSVLRGGLSAEANLRWNWSRAIAPADAAPAETPPPKAARAGARRHRRR